MPQDAHRKSGNAGNSNSHFADLFPEALPARLKFRSCSSTVRDREISTSGDAGGRKPEASLGKGVLGTVMRRRLEAIIPIVLLAILVQLIAPIAAFRAVAYAATDPLHMASICSQ